MEETIQKFIRSELWELVDAVVEYKDYGGQKPELDYIKTKEEKLINLVGQEYYKNEYNPSINQARFIIHNALRLYGMARNEIRGEQGTED